MKRPTGWTETEYRAFLEVLRDMAWRLPADVRLRCAAIAAGKAK